MDAKLKEEWVKALRSGEYRQGRTYFDRYGKFCCLGVLCKVADQPTEIGTTDNWAFVEDQIKDSGKVTRLIYLNDDHKAPFPQIADYIEANL